ncbi:hypothetical protein [Rhizobium laguerreae]|uniref:hypothetical protein n=1 Tax=Rhizobium laguerreae TaxID=1076926 RepID=UPI001C903666|nr:hypothetical protein [Rhizobium laguerreae]MBY3441776.1 hypothetical protein [Rhizobium laguerreae]
MTTFIACLLESLAVSLYWLRFFLLLSVEKQRRRSPSSPPKTAMCLRRTRASTARMTSKTLECAGSLLVPRRLGGYRPEAVIAAEQKAEVLRPFLYESGARPQEQ